MVDEGIKEEGQGTEAEEIPYDVSADTWDPVSTFMTGKGFKT